VNLPIHHTKVAELRNSADFNRGSPSVAEPRAKADPQCRRPPSRWLLGLGVVGLVSVVSCTPASAPTSPTVSTAATAVASPVATLVAASPVASAVAASPVRITSAQLSPTDATISVQNAGTAAVDMTGWKLRVGTATVTLPSNSRAAPGEAVTIHTAAGTSGGRDVYLGSESAALVSALQPGVTVALLDAQGATMSEFTLPR